MWLSRIALAMMAAALVVWAVCTGCGPGDMLAGPVGSVDLGGDQRPTAGGVPPAPHDVLMLAYSNDPDTLNPITASDTVSAAFQRQVLETLADVDYADPDRLLPALATHWEFDEENLEFTIHLRRGVKWHPMQLPDGTPLPQREMTARDVKFSFDCVLNPYVEAAHIRSYFEDPDAEDPSQRYKIKVTVVDDYTVKVKWTKPYFLAPEFTLAGFPIIPRHVYSVDEYGEPISFDFSSREFAEGFNAHWANTRLCGSGPMMFERWRRNEYLALVRFEDYWDKPYYFSHLVMRRITNSNTMAQKLLARELDFAGFPEKYLWFQAAKAPNVQSGDVRLAKYPYPGYRYIGYNLDRPIFRDKQLRWALAYATPVQQMIDVVFQKLAVRVTGPFLPGSSACDPLIKPIPHDLAKARRLLDEAGWKDTDGDGVRDKQIDGVRMPAMFDLLIFADSPSFRTVAEIYQAECRKVGVKVQITPAKWALMLEKINNKEFDAVMLGWGTGWQKGDPFQIWHSSQADKPYSSNCIAYRNPEVDRLIDELRVTFDEKRQIELYHRIHRLIYEDQPYTFLFSEFQTAGHDGRIQNVHFYKLRPCVDTREWFANQPRKFW